MLINLILNFISLYFLAIRFIYVNIYRKSNFQTFPGFLLLKFKIDFLKLYLLKYKVPLILITGTNGKTSTTHLLTHILKSQGLIVLTNYSGSNLKRGLLSTLILNRFKRFDYLVLEVDEGSVLDVTNSLPNTIKERYLILLNLSRDQLDRYGEVDLIASNINKAVISKNLTLITSTSEFSHHFKNKILIDSKINVSAYSAALDIAANPHLVNNLTFLITLIFLLKLNIDISKISKFNLVLGRGKKFILNGYTYELHLSKNPVSFNNSLSLLASNQVKNVLIVMNDNIPDGRDVSWFYDIDFNLIRDVLKNKNVYVAGSRSYDFYNLLKVAGLSSFNIKSFLNYTSFAEKINISETFILSNYSATVSITKIAEKYV